jgi:hypothetical protein
MVDPLEKGSRQCAQTRTDLYHQVVRPWIDRVDDTTNALPIRQEVLAEALPYDVMQ